MTERSSYTMTRKFPADQTTTVYRSVKGLIEGGDNEYSGLTAQQILRRRLLSSGSGTVRVSVVIDSGCDKGTGVRIEGGRFVGTVVRFNAE